jgi:transcriptional regulator with XRE-family HTH domain
MSKEVVMLLSPQIEHLRREVINARARGVRQYEIARRAKLHPTVLSAILTGAIPVRPSDSRLARVAEALGVSAEFAQNEGMPLTAA